MTNKVVNIVCTMTNYFMKDIHSLIFEKRKSLGLSQRDFADKLGTSGTLIGYYENGRNTPKANFFVKWKEVFGEDLLANNVVGDKELTNLNGGTRPNAYDLGTPVGTHQTKNNSFTELSGGKYIMPTPLVTTKGRAGYLSGWGDAEYLEELPQHAIITDKPVMGEYISFEVAGDSMDDGSSKSIQNGDIVTGRKIERSLWKNKLHLKKFTDFVIVTLDGILIKQILNHDTTNGKITCHSLNADKKEYPDFELSLTKVMQIFNIVQITKKR